MTPKSQSDTAKKIIDLFCFNNHTLLEQHLGNMYYDTGIYTHVFLNLAGISLITLLRITDFYEITVFNRMD